MSEAEKEPSIEFRKPALESLAGTNAPSTVIRVITAKSWVTLLAALAMAISLMIWCFWGSITIWVEGEGILLPEKGNIYNIVSPAGPSHISKIQVNTQDIVYKGDLIATMRSPALTKEVEVKKRYIQTLNDQYKEQNNLSQMEVRSRRETVEQQNETLNRTLKNATDNLVSTSQLLEKRREALKKKIISNELYHNTLNKYYDLKAQVESLNNRLLQNKVEVDSFMDLWTQRLENLETKMREEQHALNLLQVKLIMTQNITAPVDGIIIGIQKSVGDVLREGDVVANIAATGMGMDAIVYLQPKDGKKVKLNMATLVSPDSIKKEEYGSILGVVKSVSPYPVPRESMQTVLQNKELVEKFTKGGSPIAVWIQLQPDEKTFSKLKWSSSRGPEQLVTPGTLVTVRVVVREQSPFSMVIPALRKLVNP